jgi:membrane-associated protease RseP (regulator of RpoE activity)
MPTNPTGTRRILMLALMGGFAAGSAVAQPADPGAPPWLRGRIGVVVQPLTPELREHFGAAEDRGVLVARVEAGRPGERAGLRVGDLLLEANNEPLASPGDLLRIVASVAEGAILELRVLRDGEERTVKVEPEGGTTPFLRPDAWEGWSRWLDRGLRQGSRELRERIEQLERRLEELEQRLESQDLDSRPT